MVGNSSKVSEEFDVVHTQHNTKVGSYINIDAENKKNPKQQFQLIYVMFVTKTAIIFYVF